MNILVITIGTSDVQISSNPGNGFQIENNILKKEGLPNIGIKPNRNYHDYVLLASSRKDGKIINDHYDQFKSILHFPLIQPLIESFI